MSRSLGTLTVDLVAEVGGFVRGMDASERKTKEWRRKVDRNVKGAADIARKSVQALAVGVAAAGAALTAMTAIGLRQVDSQMKLARSLNTSYDSVTALNMAFSDGGIDGYEASLNRLNRRLGAAELGRGAALNTVKDLNLNLKELSQLDADERLAVIADRISEVSTNSQTAARFAQDLGFEQAQAAQFFLQGGDAIRGYSQQVDELGLSLSDISAQNVERANAAMGVMGDITKSLTQQLAAEAAPMIEGISIALKDWIVDMGGVPQIAERVFSAVAYAVGVAADGVDGLIRVFQLAKVAVEMFGPAARYIMLDVARTVIDFPTQAVNGLIELLNKIPKVEIEGFQQSELSQSITSEMILAANALSDGVDEMAAIRDRKHPSELLAEWIELGMANARESAKNGVDDISRVVEDFEFSDDVINRFDSLNSSLASSLERAIKQYSDYYQEIQALEDEGILSANRASELRIRAEEQYLEALNEIRKEESGYWERWLDGARDAFTSFEDLAGTVLENFSGQFGDAFESMIFDSKSLGDSIGDMAVNMSRAVINALGQMTAQWLAYQAVQLVTGKQTQLSAATTLTANAQASALQAGINAFSSTAAIPIVGPVLAPAAMTAALAVTQPMAVAVGASALSGMAHDGIDSIPQTGTWLLEKGERVTTAETSAKLDRTLDNIQYNQGGSMQLTQEFNIGGDASDRTVAMIREAARQGAEEGYKMVLNDFRKNGPARQMIRG